MTQVGPLLNEASANLLIDHLKSSFNAELAKVDNQYNDHINLEPVDNESIYISDKVETLRCPAIYVLFGEMAFNYTENPNYLDASNDCIVVVTAEDIGSQTLTRKMWRYGRVLYNVLNLADFNSDDGRLHVKSIPKRLGYSDTSRVTEKLGPQEKKFRMDCVLDLELKHFEKNLTDI